MTGLEIIAGFKDFALAVAAATTATVAVFGLKTWNRELKGKAEFEAARNLARSTYRLRDALRMFRAPFYSAGEFPDSYKLGSSPTPHEEARAWSHIYQNRWAPLLLALQDFDANSLEAEALWGASVRSNTDALRDCVGKLNAAVDADLSDKEAGGQHFQADEKFRTEIRGVLATMPRDQQNEFSQKIAAAVKAIEQQVQSHLHRS